MREGAGTDDEVVVPAGTYTLTLPGPAEDAGLTGDLDITDNLTLTGAGAATTILQACAPEPPAATCTGIDRVLHVDPAAAGVTVDVRGMTIQNGRVYLIPFVSPAGGGILLGATGTCCRPSGRLTLSDSVVRGNEGGNGGGIANRGGTLTLVNSTVSENKGSGGGGIFNEYVSDTTLVASTVRDNATFDGPGGGILSYSGGLTVRDSTISGNIYSGLYGAAGGGIAVIAGMLRVTNSTVSGNRLVSTGGSSGGGLYVERAGPHTIRSSTITDNEATGPSGSSVGAGGIALPNIPGILTLSNTILAGNRAVVGGYPPAAGPDCGVAPGGVMLSGGHNLIGNSADCAFSTSDGDQVGTPGAPIDPRLGALADNGGPTLTHALFADSPAIDGGNPGGCTDDDGNVLEHDQRGKGRTMDGNGDGTAECDAGGFEFENGVSLTGSRPGHASNGGAVCALVYGGGFADGAIVKLKRDGEPDIPGNPANADESGSVISTSFDLAGKTPGLWDLMVMNPDGTGATREDAFTIDGGGGPVLWADFVGLGTVRAGAPTRFALLYGNRGNTDAHAVPLVIGVTKGMGLRQVFAVTPPPSLDGQLTTDWSNVPMEGTSDGVPDVTILPLFLSIVPAGFTGALNFEVFAPGDWNGRFVNIDFSIGRPYVHQDDTDGTVDGTDVDGETSDGVTRGALDYAERVFELPRCVSVLPELRDRFTSQLDDAVGLGGSDWVTNFGAVPRVYSPVQLMIGLAEVATTLCGWSIPPGFPRGAGGCGEIGWDDCTPPSCSPAGKKKKWPGARACGCPPNPLEVVGSRDPNDKAAPTRPDGPAFLTGLEPLRYAIFFENVGNAPAQKVVLTDPLDMANMNVGTLSFGPMTFGAHQVNPPPGLSRFTKDVDLRPDEQLVCRIDAGVDLATGLLSWSLTSIDPTTGLMPVDPLVGCLPPNTVHPEGEGNIVFTLDGTPPPTGTEICNHANITFDVNDPIETPDRCITIDNTPPSSQVDSAETAACSQGVLVTWSGDDVGSRLASFSLFVSEDGGPFQPWLENTVATSATFVGAFGRRYAFYSAASDIAGNNETEPGTADKEVLLEDCTPHDFAVAKINAPKTVSLTSRQMFLTKQIKVQIQNRGPNAETVADAATLEKLVRLAIGSRAGCASPDPVLHRGKPQKPLPMTFKPKQKRSIVFDVTFDCANDPLESTATAAHGDFEVSASVDQSVLGGGDAHPDDDGCPRTVAPPYVIDHYPDGKIRDKGCGAKKADKTFGAPVVVDVVVKP